MEELIIYARKSLKSRLPEGKNGCIGPKNGSIIVVDNVSGELKPKQIRTYDSDGKPIKDIDFNHDHKGLGSPHAHDWFYDGNQAPNKSRDNDGRILNDKENAELKDLFDRLNRVKSEDFKRQLFENGLHDEEISSIKFKDNSIVIETKYHVVSFMAVVDADLNNLRLQNVLLGIEFNSNWETKQEKNSFVIIPKDKNPLEVLIPSSVGICGVVICQKVKIRTK